MKREGNFDLLKILSMFLIICFHNVWNGQYEFPTFTFNAFLIKYITMFGELGVNCFILTTGYFMIKSSFKKRKLISLLMEIQFYYLICRLVNVWLGYEQIERFQTVYSLFFPFIYKRYWFATAYILVYIFVPYINSYLLRDGGMQEEHRGILKTSLILWCVIPTFFGIIVNGTEGILYFNRFIWLVIMYITGAYIRLYDIRIFNNLKSSLLVFILSNVLIIISILVIQYNGAFFSKIGIVNSNYFWRPNTVLLFMSSISLFAIFKNLHIPSLKILQSLASVTFAVYMIHDGPLSDWIWKDLFHVASYGNSHFLLLYIILFSLILYLCGYLADLVRKLIWHWANWIILYSRRKKIC